MGSSFLPFSLLCALISWVSHIPGQDLPYAMPFIGFDKMAHCLVFTGVGLTARWALPQSYYKAVALGLAFAVFDETHQYFVPGRHCELWDVLADAAGVVLGGAAPFWAKKLKGKG